MRYVLVQADDAVQLIEYVNEGIGNGFEPLGGVAIDNCIYPNSASKLRSVYCQAMVKKDLKPDTD